MEIIFIYNKTNNQNKKVKDKIVNYVNQSYNVFNHNTESLILPVVPVMEFPHTQNLDKFSGLENEYNLTSYEELKTFAINSFFPVNKDYSFLHVGSEPDGNVYVDFLSTMLNTQTPFRLIAYDVNSAFDTGLNVASNILNQTQNAKNIIKSPFDVRFDGLVVVKSFKHTTENNGDIAYNLELSEFINKEMLINWLELGINAGVNMIKKTDLKAVGLI